MYRNERDLCGEDLEEPPVVRATGPDRGLYTDSLGERERGRVQPRARDRVLHTQEPLVPRVRDARRQVNFKLH